jgi:tripartite-type tricarboxylate transporter receptor subunit TctC
MKPSRRQLLQLAATGLATPLVRRVAWAEAWPTKSIRAIVPIGPGTGVDILSRLALHELSSQLGQPIVIDNRPGAGGSIGAAAVANAEPDWYTILAESSTHTLIPYVYAHLTYDPMRDLSPVIPLGEMPLVVVCAPSKGINTIHDLVSTARSKPGSLSYASGGTGTTTHLSVERLQLSAGFQAVHVPYRSAAYGADLISGRVDFACMPLGPALELIRDGRLHALAVSSRTRAAVLPKVPTTLEAGYANSEFNFYVGMFVPAKTPTAIVERLNRDSAAVLGTSSMREKFARIGAEPMIMTATNFEAFIAEEYRANGALVRAIGLAPV